MLNIVNIGERITKCMECFKIEMQISVSLIRLNQNSGFPSAY